MSKRKKAGRTITLRGRAARAFFQVATGEKSCPHDSTRRVNCPQGNEGCWCCDACHGVCGKRPAGKVKPLDGYQHIERDEDGLPKALHF